MVEGEVDRDVDLILKGRYLNETCHMEVGSVRWEMYAPPRAEVAELRTRGGDLLARWDFSLPESSVAARPPTSEKPSPSPATATAQQIPFTPLTIPKRRSPFGFWPDLPPIPQVLALSKPISRPVNMALASRQVHPTTPSRFRTMALSAIPQTPTHVIPSEVHTPEPVVPLPPVGELRGDWPGAGEALNLLRGERGSHQVCMTFDGGSTAEVAKDILDVLQERGIHTTFFLTGDFILRFPDIVRRMDREGHEIANHTMTHPHLAPGMKRDPRWTKERFQQELLDADLALFQLLGHPMDPYWRAPFGEHTPELRRWAEELGYRHVGWSEGADTLDWATTKERSLYRSGDAILDRLHRRLEKVDGDGLIVLMHLGSGRPESDRPARVLGPFLDQAIHEGWHLVKISEYVRGMGKPVWESSRRLSLLNARGASPRLARKR